MIRSDYKGKWVRNVHGNHTGGEITILRDDYTHGKKSWGWCDNSGFSPKILILSTHCFSVPKKVWGKALVIAEEYAQEMNEKEERE